MIAKVIITLVLMQNVYEESGMNKEQLMWCMKQAWYVDHIEIGNNITPIYKVRVSDGGLLTWFSDYNKLISRLGS